MAELPSAYYMHNNGQLLGSESGRRYEGGSKHLAPRPVCASATFSSPTKLRPDTFSCITNIFFDPEDDTDSAIWHGHPPYLTGESGYAIRVNRGSRVATWHRKIVYTCSLELGAVESSDISLLGEPIDSLQHRQSNFGPHACFSALRYALTREPVIYQ